VVFRVKISQNEKTNPSEKISPTERIIQNGKISQNEYKINRDTNSINI
jgi:hypothetical protein